MASAQIWCCVQIPLGSVGQVNYDSSLLKVACVLYSFPMGLGDTSSSSLKEKEMVSKVEAYWLERVGG